ncbi:MAG: type II secretion system protein [Deltaproteobacteria bacterium]|nr:type II secretion system protein [Deltaproteobacteria bacterium]
MRKQSGFTLVEIILSITLMGILFTLSSLVLVQGLNAYRHISARATNLNEARYALERMVRELRREGDENNIDDIKNIQSNSITFIDALGNNTSFSLSGQNLLRDNDLLLNNVTALVFTGYRDTGAETSSAQQVRRVRIQLTTTPPGQVASLLLVSDVFLRNYMYENFQ